MIESRRRVLPALAAVFIVAGFGLMVASLGIEADSASSGQFAADVTVPSAFAIAASPVASDPHAVRLVQRAQEADRTRAYGGTKVVSRWSGGKHTSVVVAVDHEPGEGTAVAPGDTGTSVEDADAQVVTVEAAQRADDVMLGALVRNYTLTRASDVITTTGRTAHVVDAIRADGTAAARFWFDDGTGLVLRRDVMDTNGAKLESSSFVQVTFRAAPTPTATDAARTGSGHDWALVSAEGADALRAAGWPVPRTMPAGMELYQVRQQGTGKDEDEVLQLSYTDGLSAISVFVQHGSLDERSLAGYEKVHASTGDVWVRSSGTRFLTWQARNPPGTTAADRGLVVSVTTDSLGAPTGSAVAAFPPVATDEGGITDHVTRGVERVGSWIDPLD